MASNGRSAERLLVVVAHPDDETFGTGSLLAHACRSGVATTVLCATRGEAGDPRPGSVPDGSTLAEVRERELRRAADVLGVTQVKVLGWTDTGMDGPPDAGTLVAAPFDRVVEEVVRVIEEVEPTTVVTLDASDGHRDHVRMRDATLAAAATARPTPARVYLHCLPQTLMRRWVTELERRDPSAAHLGLGELGTPDHLITTRIDTSELIEVREMAMALHASQAPPYDVMPADLRRAFLATDQLRRVVPAWEGGRLERSLFDGEGRPGP